MEIVVPHNHNIFAATQKIKGLLTKLKEQYAAEITDVVEKWEIATCNFSFLYSGMAISGKIVAIKGSVSVTGELPFLANMFKTEIEQTIRQHAEELLK